MSISFTSSVLTLGLVFALSTSKANTPQNDLREVEYVPSYCKLLSTKDADLNGKMRVHGTIVRNYSDRKITRPIIVVVNNKIVDTVRQGRFDLLFSEGQKIKSIAFKSPYYRYESATTEAIEFQPNKSLKYVVKMNQEIIEEAEKPVIYLYPEKETKVDLSLDMNGQLRFTYPQYNNGWSCTAQKDGKLNVDGKSYDYLFYDADITLEAYNENEGFLVESKHVVSFLEESLTTLGLNASEQNDFITYWAPRMVKNEFNHVQFLVNEDYEAISKLNVTPKPETSIRVYMFFKNVGGDHFVQKSNLPKLNRQGFTLIEWGGTEVKTTKETL